MSGDNPARLRLVLEVIVWWALCFGLWLVTLSAAPLQELLVAAAVSLPCGVLAVAARRASGNAWTVRLRWFRALAVFPVAVLSDTAQVLAARLPARRAQGRLQTLPLEGGAGETPEAGGRRAVATILVSVTPGTFVVDIDPDQGEMVVHQLATAGPRQDQVAVE